LRHAANHRLVVKDVARRRGGAFLDELHRTAIVPAIDQDDRHGIEALFALLGSSR
jgi:hypothetical protein